MDDVDEVIELTNRIVQAMNANDRNTALASFLEWNRRFLHRPEIFCQVSDTIFMMARLSYHLGHPEVAYALAPSIIHMNELDDLDVILQDMGPGTMIDVGAQWGTTLRACLWRGWRVLAFEPDGENRTKLANDFGDFRNLTIDSRGISDAMGSDIPFYRGTNSNVRSLHGNHEVNKEAGGYAKIDVTTLDMALGENNIDHIMFLKIDVEGYEMKALEGFPWERLHPEITMVEFDEPITREMGYSAIDLGNYLEDKGYTNIYSEWDPIVRYGTRHTWLRYTQNPKSIHPEAWGNILSFSKPHIAERFLREEQHRWMHMK